MEKETVGGRGLPLLKFQMEETIPQSITTNSSFFHLLLLHFHFAE